MRQFILIFCIMLFSSISLSAQNKSVLIAEVHTLKMQLDSLKSELFNARKTEKVSLAKAESYETQVTELQDANTTLLKNLNSFAEVSNKNSDNINKAMSSLDKKEKQLKEVNAAVARNDSTAIVVLTNAKQTLGENAKIGVSGNSVVISTDLGTLFGGGSSAKIAATGGAWLQKIATILAANPDMAITVEGLTMTGNLDLAGQQAAVISGMLQKQFSIAPERITALGKDGNFKEGITIKIHPKFNQFYAMVKENMKNNN